MRGIDAPRPERRRSASGPETYRKNFERVIGRASQKLASTGVSVALCTSSKTYHAMGGHPPDAQALHSQLQCWMMVCKDGGPASVN